MLPDVVHVRQNGGCYSTPEKYNGKAALAASNAKSGADLSSSFNMIQCYSGEGRANPQAK